MGGNKNDFISFSSNICLKVCSSNLLHLRISIKLKLSQNSRGALGGGKIRNTSQNGGIVYNYVPPFIRWLWVYLHEIILWGRGVINENQILFMGVADGGFFFFTDKGFIQHQQQLGNRKCSWLCSLISHVCYQYVEIIITVISTH